MRNSPVNKPFDLNSHEKQLAQSYLQLQALVKSKAAHDAIHRLIAKITDQVGNIHVLLNTIKNDKSFSQYMPDFNEIKNDLEANDRALVNDIQKILPTFKPEELAKVKLIFTDILKNFNESKNACINELTAIEKGMEKKSAPSSQSMIMNKLHESDLNDHGKKVVEQLKGLIKAKDDTIKVTSGTKPGLTKITIEGNPIKARALISALGAAGTPAKLEYSKNSIQQPIAHVTISNNKLNNLNQTHLKAMPDNLKKKIGEEYYQAAKDVFSKKDPTTKDIIAAGYYFSKAKENGQSGVSSKYKDFLKKGDKMRAFMDSDKAKPEQVQDNMNIMMRYYLYAEKLKPGCTKKIAESVFKEAKSYYKEAKHSNAEGKPDQTTDLAAKAARYFDCAQKLGNNSAAELTLECRLMNASSALKQNNFSVASEAFNDALKTKNNSNQEIMPTYSIIKFQNELLERGKALATNANDDSTKLLAAKCFSKCIELEAVSKINVIPKSDAERIGEFLYLTGNKLESEGKRIEALNSYLQAISLGHLKANTNAGYMYLKGGVGIDGGLTQPRLAFPLLTKSADEGHARAQFYLAEAYHSGPVKDVAKAKHYFELLINNTATTAYDPKVLEEIKNKAREIVAQYNQMPDIKKQITTLFAVNPHFQTRDMVLNHNAKHGEIGLYFRTESECAIAKSVLSKYITQSKDKSVILAWSPDLVAALSDKNLSQRVQDAKAEINNIFTPTSPKR